MTTFKSVVTGVALAGAAALLATGASAEGLPSSGRVAEPQFNWTGFYVGLNAGYAWGDASLRSKFGCSAGPDPDFCPLGGDADFLGILGALASGSGDVDGFTGGIQAGYNWQRGNVVFGLEADFDSLDLGGTVGATGFIVAPETDPRAFDLRSSFTAEWLLTVRARLGVTLAPNVLAYATGGLALTEIEVTNSYFDTGIPGSLGPVSGSSSSSKVRTGWTVGGGLEWALDRNWTIRGEYLYVDFGSVSTRAGVTALDASPNTFDTSADFTAHIGRAAINYKF